MKRLLLLRHAKSSWDNPALTDHERPLNKRGLRTAPLIGEVIVQHDLMPDAIVSSTAERAQTTAEIVARSCGYDDPIVVSDELYLAPPMNYIAVARDLDDRCRTAILVGHNPGIEALASQLAESSIRMTTANLVAFTVAIDRWKDLEGDSTFELIDVWRPRDLED